MYMSTLQPVKLEFCTFVLSVQIYIPSKTSVISSNGQGQLCPLTCAEGKDLLNHTRISTIQSRTLEKKAKNHKTLT